MDIPPVIFGKTSSKRFYSNQLHLLQQLYGSIIIPEAVYRELTDLDSPVPGTSEVQTYDWIEMRQVLRELRQDLDGRSPAVG